MNLTNVALIFFISILLRHNCNFIRKRDRGNLNKLEITSLNKIPLVSVLSLGNKIDENLFSWLYSGGNQIIQIRAEMSKKEINEILSNSNGVVFPPTPKFDTKDTKLLYENTAKHILNKIEHLYIKHNKTNLPLLALCNGANLVQILLAEDENIMLNLTEVNNTMLPVEVIGPPRRIKLISHFDGRDFYSLREKNSTYQSVNRGVDYSYYESNINLKRKLKITGLSKDHNKTKYVSMFEGYEIPIYGIVFNPELIPWKRNLKNISYTNEAITISQKLLNFFTNQARLSNNGISNIDDLQDKYITENIKEFYCKKSLNNSDNIRSKNNNRFNKTIDDHNFKKIL